MSLNETINNLGDSIINLVDKKRHGTLGLEQGDVGYDKEVFEDIRKYKHSTFDKSKFTVVGSPNITEDGIASGFATGYLSPIVNLGNPSNVKISISGVLSELSGTVARTYFSLSSGDYTVRLYLNKHNKLSGEMGNYITKEYIYLGGDAYLLALNAKFKTILNIDVKNNTVQQIVYINDELLFEGPVRSPGVFNFDTDFVFSSAKMVLGAGGYDAYTGSIDLKEFSVTVDGIEVFNGNKTGLDVIKEDNYTVVGSPVISEDGVASGFNSNNVLTLPLGSIVNGKKTMEFLSPVYYIESNPTHEVGLFGSTRTPNHHSFEFWLSTNLTLTATIYYGTDIPGIMVRRDNVPGISVGDTLQFKITKDDTYWNVYYRINNLEYIQVQSVYPIQEDSRLLDFDTSKDFYIGGETDNTGSRYDCGSIDLNALKIYVDGNLVYQPCLKIPYILSKTGSKIVNEVYRDRVIDLYEQKGYTGYYTIQENKKDNYAVVGNPTIVDGVASGFNANNYLYAPITFTSNNKIKITDKFTYTSEYISGKGKQIYAVGNQQFRLLVQPTRFITYVDKDSSAFSIGGTEFTIDINDTVYYELIIDNSAQHSLKIWKNGQLYVNKTSTVVTNFDKTKFYIGTSNWGDYASYSSIDLNAFKIYIDDKLAYQAIIPPNYTLPMGDVYGVLSAKSNSSEIAHYAMPSDKYIDLTLGESGSTYTAPANGWFYVVKTSSASNQYLNIYNKTSSWLGIGCNTSASGQQLRYYLPVKKGDEARVTYSMGGENADYDTFKFIYAEGEKQ